MDRALLEFAECAMLVHDEKALRDLFECHLQQLGFDRFAYLVLRWPDGSLAPQAVTTYPMEWARRYAEQNYINRDQVVPTAAASIMPFDWRAINLENEGQRRVFNEAGEYGIRNGITVPLHGPGGALAAAMVLPAYATR